MDKFTNEFIWLQFGASIDTLENVIIACPDDLWGDRTQRFEYWYACFHTLFWLDYYLSKDTKEFKPPEPFGLEEMDPAGVLPDRVYTKEELLTYLKHGRNKAKVAIYELTEERAVQPYLFGKATLSFAELLLYIMRHIQHHAAQLNLILREKTGSATGWVFQAK